jgi:hypothetical protein
MMKTERMVKAMPLLSTLVASWWSILVRGSDLSLVCARAANLHVVRQRDLALLVADDGELQLAAGDLVDVLDPAIVRVDGVRGEADELCAAAGELRLELGERAELSCADGGVVFRVGEQNDPVVADELVEVDGTLRRLGLEVGGLAAQTERLGAVGHGVGVGFYQPVSLIQTAQTAQTGGVAG